MGYRGFLGSAISRAFSGHGAGVLGYAADSPIVSDGVLAQGVDAVSTVVWAAARVNPRLAVERPDLADADVAEFAEFVALASALERPPRVILISSGGTVYGGDASPPFVESSPLSPVNAYGEVKARQERVLSDSALHGTALRVANAYGPGQRPAPGQAVLAHWMTAVMEHRSVALLGNPDATRDYVYIDDIAAAVYAAHVAQTPLPPAVNVGSGVATTLEQLLDSLRLAVAPRTVHVERGSARPTDADHSVLDVALAKDAIGWTPQVNLEEGVTRMWKWMSA